MSQLFSHTTHKLHRSYYNFLTADKLYINQSTPLIEFWLTNNRLKKKRKRKTFAKDAISLCAPTSGSAGREELMLLWSKTHNYSLFL